MAAGSGPVPLAVPRSAFLAGAVAIVELLVHTLLRKTEFGEERAVDAIVKVSPERRGLKLPAAGPLKYSVKMIQAARRWNEILFRTNCNPKSLTILNILPCVPPRSFHVLNCPFKALWYQLNR